MLKLRVSNQPLWFSAFILLLAVIPLPFGSNRPWSSDLLALSVGILLLAMIWHRHKSFPSQITGRPPQKRILFSVIGFSLVAIWSFVQTLHFVPIDWQNPLWEVASTDLGTIKGSITLNASLFPESFIRLLSYAGFFLLAFFSCQDEKNARKIINWLAYAAAIYAIYGLIIHASGSNMILWYDKWAYKGFVTSTFVNKNSYATYAGLGLICCLAQLYWNIRKVKIKDKLLAKQTKLLALFSSLTLKDMSAFIPTIFVLGALALTGSRGGVLSSIIGVAIFILSFAIHKKIKIKQWFWLTTAIGAIFIIFVSLGGDALLSRLGETKINDDTNIRVSAYELSAKAISNNPIFGYGLDNFEEAFRIYRDETLPLWYHHAHNDYLEMMMDLGVPVAFLLFASIASLISCCISGLRIRKKNGIYPSIAIGASTIIITHSFVDFSMHIPAIAATYSAVLGVGVAQSWSSKKI